MLRVAWAKKSGIARIASSHLLQDSDEESDLNLSAGLKQTIERGGPFCFGENAEPLLDSAEFLFEVLVNEVRQTSCELQA